MRLVPYRPRGDPHWRGEEVLNSSVFSPTTEQIVNEDSEKQTGSTESSSSTRISSCDDMELETCEIERDL